MRASLTTTHLLVVPTPALRTAVYCTEAGCGEGDEHLWPGSYLWGDVVAASGGSGGDELPGVTGVQV
jgi:hypothetical protein